MTKKTPSGAKRPRTRQSDPKQGDSTTAEKQKLPGWMPDFLVRAAAGVSTGRPASRAAAPA
ncbi:MAG TPA: hypothetical protein DDZ67_03895, partial [Xanthomonadaceae bacterium]|nr:hypothetical protein [Xanthomonadaceae bacterium]